jgi:hypothetical protein
MGRTGFNYSNGDGVLMYPGTDTVFPADSYGVNGPLVSLRMKHWRRGIQDAEYLRLASQKSPAQVKELLRRMVPKVFWEIGITDPADPSWVRADISWPVDPDEWERARRELANAILGAPQASKPKAPTGLVVR